MLKKAENLANKHGYIVPFESYANFSKKICDYLKISFQKFLNFGDNPSQK